jgi:hypothetical protein
VRISLRSLYLSCLGEGQGPLRLPVDENRLIVKKYNSTPATQAELRDCTAELSQDNLKLVVGSHKVSFPGVFYQRRLFQWLGLTNQSTRVSKRKLLTTCSFGLCTYAGRLSLYCS